MNRIYKVVWNATRNCYVVTSELTKTHTKGGTAKKLFNIIALTGLLIFSTGAGQVLAAPSELVPGEGPGIAVGNESKAKSENAIALGNKSSAEDENVIAMGPGAVARAKGSLAIGLEAETGKATLSGQSAEDSIAIGTRATTFGMESIAIGKESHSDGQAVVIGSEAKSNTTDPKGAVVIGYKSITKNGNTVTIGDEATTEANNGIAIGTQSLVRGHGGLAIGGTGSLLRPIDAPHVSDILPGAVALGQTSMALGPQAMSSGESSIALGLVSHAAGENALAIGQLTYAGTLAHAAGYKARAIGTATQAQGMYSVATGAGGLAFGPYAVSVGSPSFKQGKPTSDAGYGIAIGGESFSSGYSAALGFKAQANGRGSLALGVGATVGLEDIQAITDKNVEGYLAENQDVKDLIESRYASELKKFQADDRHKNKALAGFVREYLYAQKAETMGNMKGTAIGYMTTVSAPTGVALGAHSIGDRAEFTTKTIAPFSEVDLNGKTLAAVSVGQKDGLRQIIHVADGTEDTDAVNLRQLKGLKDQVDKSIADAKSGDTTLSPDNNALTLKDNKLSLLVKDTAGNEVKGSVDLSSIASTKDTRNTVAAGEHVTLTTKDNALGGTEYTIHVKADGKIEKNTKELVNGGTVFVETRVEKDGYFIKADNSAADNLKALDRQVEVNANNINRMGTQVNKVGAGAAALAALHPLDFDPDDKWNVSIGYGNYKSNNAVALGAFYRPNENTMFSLGATVGNGENMVNAGVTFALDRGSNITTSRTAMAKDILDLQNLVIQMQAQMDRMANVIEQLSGSELHSTPFPDVPENHWAYEYVEGLRKKGLVGGYPDGSFAGNRNMTRYEFAAVLYRALLQGERLDARAATEFAPELGRIRVDRIAGEDTDRNKIERVRVNNKDSMHRDTYGSKI